MARKTRTKLIPGRPKRQTGRPSIATGVTPLIALRLPAELRERVERIAKGKGVPLSQVIREAIVQFTQNERRKP